MASKSDLTETVKPATRKKPAPVELTVAALPQLVAEYSGTLADVHVTKELATAVLAFNTHNRPLRPSRVRRFIDILASERWVNTGEPAILSRMALNEGQHRLAAIVESDIPAPMDFRFGVSERAFAVTGTGGTRSPADVFGIMQVQSATTTAAAIRLVIAYERGIAKSSPIRERLGNDELLDGLRRWPEIATAVRIVLRRLSQGGSKLYSAPMTAGTFLALTTANEGTVDEFVQIVETGLTQDPLSPPRLLREKLLQDFSLRNGTREASTRKLALYIEAWNAWRGGDRPRALGWRYGMEFPKMQGVKL